MFEKLIQVGIVIGELNRVMESSINIYDIGPWYVINFSPKNVDSMTLYGKKLDYSMKLAVCSIGTIRFEYIEPITNSIYTDYFNDYSEYMIHHLKLGVSNYIEALSFLKSKNLDVIQSGHQLGDCGKNIYTYVDTKKKFGFITEIVRITEDFIKPAPDYWFPSESKSYNPIFIRPSAVGIVVRDIEIKIRDYEDLNIGPWQIHEFGKEDNLKFKAKMAFCSLGDVVFKLIEPQSDSIFSEFFSKYGEGIHHLKMEVDNYEKALKHLKSKGVKTLYSDNYLEKIHFSFLDTNKHLNFITEISDRKINPTPHSNTIIHP